jgi:hypothetical protein
MLIFRYIGHKGIGFKAVFQVTSSPRVHSRNFHFGFQAPSEGGRETNQNLGYIIPSPLPIPEGWDSRKGTRIVLPLNLDGGAGAGDLQTLRQNLMDIQVLATCPLMRNMLCVVLRRAVCV